MRTLLFIFCPFLLIGSANLQASTPLKKFHTDYCTAYVEGTRERPGIWKHCCLEHDLYFWAGGSYDDRKESDLRLGRCVNATGEHAQAKLMYAAVALGGISPIKFKGQYFGNSWPASRPRYTPLSKAEIEVIIQEIDTHTLWLPQTLRDSFKQQLQSRKILK